MELQVVNSYSSFDYDVVGAEVFSQNVLDTIKETKIESATLLTRQGERIPIKQVVFYFKSGATPRTERISNGKLNSALNSMESVDAKDVVILTLQNCQNTIRRACTREEAENIK